ncbi:MAG: sigma-70 family RNA polymerase sigma factor [Hungatella sp.]|nr:sigma-70 family RNA polymerase sigma factor [Hungatella sp.]
MAVENADFDKLLEQWYPDIYRFCFLLSCHGESAREITFQVFLYAGADSNFPSEADKSSVKLFSYAAKTCEDYYLRKIRRLPSQDALQASVCFSVSDSLRNFLKRPPKQKAVFFLHNNLGFSSQQIGEILNLRPSQVDRLFASVSRSSFLSPDDAASIIPDYETSSQVSDDLYLRFEERNVKLENRLRDMRLSMDRAIGWIALGILGLFAAAAFYSSRL